MNKKFDYNIYINRIATENSSRGVNRYCNAVLKNLPQKFNTIDVEKIGINVLERCREILLPGKKQSILWTPCQRGPVFARNHIVTVHDCISIEYVYRGDYRKPIYLWYFNKLLDNAAAVVAISNATKSAILRNSNIPESKVLVIPSAVDAMIISSVQRVQNTEEPFVLMVTNQLNHKNNDIACKGFASSRANSEGISLRVVGSLPDSARKICMQSGVRLYEHSIVTDYELSKLYSECIFLLSPSLAEGHNLVIGEALVHGSNVLCSDIDVHREYYDGHVRYFDPLSLDSITTEIDFCLNNSASWFDINNNYSPRSFKDVAKDYDLLFTSILLNS